VELVVIEDFDCIVDYFGVEVDCVFVVVLGEVCFIYKLSLEWGLNLWFCDYKLCVLLAELFGYVS